MDFQALRGHPARVSVRALDAPPRPASEIVRLVAGLNQPVVLAGRWAAGELVVAADPILVSLGDRDPGSDPFSDPFRVVEQQPTVRGPVPEGTVAGGWFGWLGFEQGEHALGFYPHVLRLRDGFWWDEALVGIIDDGELTRRREALAALVDRPSTQPQPYRLGPISSSRGREAHVGAVERCIHAIRDGEIYQANICLSLAAELQGSAADLAADLISELDPPYGAFVKVGERQVASASPELFLRRYSRHVTSRPIKGTRPREGATPATSDRERRRLAGSVKDRAENVMIVDLVRNDLSRVAEVGTVRVSQLLDVVAHPGVWHLVSTVEADLRPDVTDGGLLRATFPPGSVTGTPKESALGVIRDLEEVPRGVYTGAIGYASPVAGLELSVAIRTAEIDGSGLRLGVGGGVTVDSTPVEEWWECFDKAWPLLAAVGGATTAPGSRRPAPHDGSFHDVAEGICDTTLLRAGEPVERADHLARLERSVYEVYQRTLPEPAARALLRPQPSEPGWQRQRIDVRPDGTVEITRRPVGAPVPVAAQPGAHAVLLTAEPAFGGYKWSDRRRHERLESEHPSKVVLLGDDAGVWESTRANVVAVCDGRLVTAPLDGRILPGVTRAVVLDLARDLGVDIDLRFPQPQAVQGLAVVSSVAGMRWITACEGPGWSARWEEPDALLCELSRRLVNRWTAAATGALPSDCEQQSLYT